MRSPILHALDELIRKRIMEAKLPQHLIPTTRLHDCQLFKDIEKCELLRNFLTPTFDIYTGASDTVQHIRYFQDKMMLYLLNYQVMCLTFPSSLRGTTLEWFYSLPLCSLHNFLEVTRPFLHNMSLAKKPRGVVTTSSLLG